MRLLLCVREESGADDVPDVESGGYNLFYSVLVVPGILLISVRMIPPGGNVRTVGV